MAKIGSVIDNKYEVLKQIGQGGMSFVYLAMDKRLNKQWAIKEIRKKARGENDEVVVQSLLAEANLMKRLDHPYLPRIVDIIEIDETIYVVMDFIEGKTLSDVMNESGAQSQEMVIKWAKQLCEALDYLHTRKPPIIYRDMKPGNVMVTPENNIKLFDFGIAREYKEDNLADTVSLGTRGYAAPEQFGGQGQTDARTDIYCLGVTLYHLVTGKNPCEPPYELYPIRYWDSDLSEGLEQIITKCTQLNPNDRYASCAELMYDLQHYREIDRSYRKIQKRKLYSFLFAAIMCLLFTASGITGLVMEKERKDSDYVSLIEEGKSLTGDEREDVLISAIDVDPTDPRAYEMLIELYGSDQLLDDGEWQILRTKIVNGQELKKTPHYAKLVYDSGILIWYMGDEGQREELARTCFSAAVEYAEEGSSLWELAKIYYDYMDLFQAIEVARITDEYDEETYLEYWEKLLGLYGISKQSKEIGVREIIQCRIFSTVLAAIEMEAQKFSKAGVDKKEVDELFDEIKEQVEGLNVVDERALQIKEEALNENRMANIRVSIDLAYSGTQEETVEGGN